MSFALKLENSAISIAVFILIFMGYTMNEIIVIKSYINTFLKNQNIEYNNYKTIFFQTMKVCLKYILILIIVFVILFIAGIIVGFFDLDKEILEQQLEHPITNIVYSFIAILLFFKLLFVEHILLFKQNLESYKIKYLVKKSYSIIQMDKNFFYISYFGINIICIFFEEIFFKNMFIIPFLTDIVQILLFMVYLIKFCEIISTEYNKTTDINIMV
jgi:hypothetical protein